MEDATKLVVEWWPVALALVAAVIKVINIKTPHATTSSGVLKLLLRVIDLLDVVKVTPPPSGVVKR